MLQYFSEGWYPSGRPNPADAIAPSGALLKAVLINSGEQLFNMYDETTGSLVALTDYPSKEASYGRVILSRILNFNESEYEDGKPLSFFFRGTIKTNPSRYHVSVIQGKVDVYHFWTTANPGPVRITLAWTDTAGISNAGGKIVNSLTLRVKDLNTTIEYLPFSTVDINGIAQNTVYVVDIPNAPGLHYWSITVRGGLVSGTQPYALVATSLNNIAPFPPVTSNSTTDVASNYESTGITKSLFVSIIILGALSALLSLVTYLIHRENVIAVRNAHRHHHHEKEKNEEHGHVQHHEHHKTSAHKETDKSV